MQLIDGNELREEIMRADYDNDTINNFLDLVDLSPVIDAEPIIHAHWIMEKNYADGDADYKCSNCEFDMTFHKGFPESFYKHCPYCGAKMDGEPQEEGR